MIKIYNPFIDELENIYVILNSVRGYRGQRDKYGVPLEPDEPEYTELVAVENEKGEDITNKFTNEQLDILLEKALKKVKQY